MMQDTKNNIYGMITLIIAILISCFLSCGCALQMNDIKRKLPDGTEETDKSFKLGTPDWSGGKKINVISFGGV